MGRNGESSSEEEGWEIINADSPEEESPSPPPTPVTPQSQRNPLPAKKKKLASTYKIGPKKGRRSMHRYTEEKSLFQW